MNELALFAGAGGGLLASRLLGWSTVAAVEIEQYPREVLLQRQRDGHLEPFPIWDDVRTFDGKPWRGLVDVVSGGFPCQDISAAGAGAGLAGARSGLWFEYLRIVGEIRPRFVFAENSPNLRTRGLGTIIEGLTGLGYGVRWGVLGAWHLGAPHARNRMFILANSDKSGGVPRVGLEQRKVQNHWKVPVWGIDRVECAERYFDLRMETQPDGVGVDDVFPDRVDQLESIGNAQVPAVAAAAWEILEGLI